MHPPKVFIYDDNGKNKVDMEKDSIRLTLEHSEEKILGITHYDRYRDTKHKHMFCNIQKSIDKDNDEKSAGLKLRQQ